MNIEDRQQAVHVPQGTLTLSLPERNAASVSRSHFENSPAGIFTGIDSSHYLVSYDVG